MRVVSSAAGFSTPHPFRAELLKEPVHEERPERIQKCSQEFDQIRESRSLLTSLGLSHPADSLEVKDEIGSNSAAVWPLHGFWVLSANQEPQNREATALNTLAL